MLLSSSMTRILALGLVRRRAMSDQITDAESAQDTKMAAADLEPPPDEADLLRLVHGRRRLRPAVPAVVAADAVLRRVRRGAARRPRLEQDRAVGRGRAAPDGSPDPRPGARLDHRDRKSTRLNSSHLVISYAVFCLKKKKI